MITLDALTKKYGDTVAVSRISFQIGQGELFALLGPNGAGKTSIVRMMLGFSRPSGGTVSIDGIPAHQPAARQGIGYLEEQHRIPARLTGNQYLARSAALMGLAGGQARREIGRVLELCGLRTAAKTRAASYSKGMRQRLGLAGALLGGPRLLILDEPTSGLDPFGIREVRTILAEMHRAGTTIVMSSHILSEVEKICDTVAFIKNGSLLLKDAIADVVRAPETLEDVFVRAMEKNNE